MQAPLRIATVIRHVGQVIYQDELVQGEEAEEKGRGAALMTVESKDRAAAEGTASDLPDEAGKVATRICVVGVGGAGANTIRWLADQGIGGVELVVLETDARNLLSSNVVRSILVGEKTLHGGGAASIPRSGEEAARESAKEIKSLVDDADIVFILAGLGGGTGSGAAPMVAQAAHEAGALTFGIVTLPFSAEGDVRRENAYYGLDEMRKTTDTLLVIPNEILLNLYPKLPLNETFHVADKFIFEAVTATGLIVNSGVFSSDDLRRVIQDGYFGYIGLGDAVGADSMEHSLENALTNPLFAIDLSKTSKAIVYFTGGARFKLSDAETVLDKIAARLSLKRDAIIWRSATNPELRDRTKLAILATGATSLKEM